MVLPQKVKVMSSCFKAYDIRGELGEQINEEIAYKIGVAYAKHIKPKKVVVGGDIRLTSESLKKSVSEGLISENVDVVDIGVAGTEEVYFAVQHLNLDGGIEVTASHNPINHNGMKLVRENARPISSDTGLKEIESIVYGNLSKLNTDNDEQLTPKLGQVSCRNLRQEYIEHLFSYIEVKNLKPLRIVVNNGNGTASHVIDLLESKFNSLQVPIEFIKIHHQPDGTFPNGIPNPMIEENRKVTTEAILSNDADLAVAWDGDFDRCFLFDEKGNFIEGYYIVGLLAEAFLKKQPGSTIVHDPRLTLNTIDIVNSNGGRALQSKCGHAFIKDIMRESDAVYGGEMSAHHYFRDFGYCDSGMIPWLLIAELMSIKSCTLSSMVKERISLYPVSGEINVKLENPELSIARIIEEFSPDASSVDDTDGVSIEYEKWRFNIRKSNTEPVVRLNVESKGDQGLVDKMTQVLLDCLRGEV